MTTRKMNLVVKEIESILGDNVKVEMHEVTKNNGLILHGVTIRFEDSLAAVPTLYLENYDETHTSREIAKEIITDNAIALEQSKEITEVNPENLMIFSDFVKSHICYHLVNKKANEELLKTVPHREFLDLVIIYTVQITNEASMKVTNQLLSEWNVNEETLYELAKENTPKLFSISIRSMFDTMLELMNLTREEAVMMGMPENDTQIIATNIHGLNGATVILYPNVIEELYAKHGKFAVLPSSIHEVIIVPMNEELTESNLTQMVQEVNEQVVSIDEILSDHAYIYDGEWK